MVVELYKFPIVDPVQCQTLVNSLRNDDAFLRQTVDLGNGLQSSQFRVEEIVKMMRSYFFANEHSQGCKHYMQQYFNPVGWPAVLLMCTALRCSLMDYEDKGYKSLTVVDFSKAIFGGY
ncbi:hypothetical protein HOY80DRAFT_1032040 [Tuber brumale]|nr:hypothetical protein HOY80DRAFT_1032040 [Tuber brumale]